MNKQRNDDCREEKNHELYKNNQNRDGCFIAFVENCCHVDHTKDGNNDDVFGEKVLHSSVVYVILFTKMKNKHPMKMFHANKYFIVISSYKLHFQKKFVIFFHRHCHQQKE